MKLLKKLMPFASVAAIAATVAPMATSCGVGANTDLKTYESKVEQHAALDTGKTWTDAEASKYYFKDNNKFADTFKDDVFTVVAKAIKSIEPANADVPTIKTAKAGVSGVSATEKTVDNKTAYLVNANVGAEVEIEYTTKVKGKEFTFSANVKAQLKLSNIPFDIEFVEETGEATFPYRWNICVLDDDDDPIALWNKFGAWGVELSASGNAKYNSITADINLSGKFNKDSSEEELDIAAMISALNIPSYHLAKVAGTK